MKVNDLSVKQRLAITLIGPVLIAVMSLGGYKFVVQATAETVKKNCKDIERIDKDQAVLKSQIPDIKESVHRIETAQIETSKDIKAILTELAKANLSSRHD